MKIAIFWFRNDIRMVDNTALNNALQSGFPVMPLYIFDESAKEHAMEEDLGVASIHQKLQKINSFLKNKYGSSVYCERGTSKDVWNKLSRSYHIEAVYVNHEEGPQNVQRDIEIAQMLKTRNIVFHSFKEEVIFEMVKVLKSDIMTHLVCRPYKNSRLKKFISLELSDFGKTISGFFYRSRRKFPSLVDLGFKEEESEMRSFDFSFHEIHISSRYFFHRLKRAFRSKLSI